MQFTENSGNVNDVCGFRLSKMRVRLVVLRPCRVKVDMSIGVVSLVMSLQLKRCHLITVQFSSSTARKGQPRSLLCVSL